MHPDEYCVLDIETTGGRFDRIPNGFTLLFAGIKTKGNYSFYESTNEALERMLRYLHSFNGIVVTFNGDRFDLPILTRNVFEVLGKDLRISRHFDLLATLHDMTGLRVSLNNLALDTLGRAKTPWDHRRNGRVWQQTPELLRQHNQEDLDLTEALFLRVVHHEPLFLGRRSIMLPLPAAY